MKLARRLAEVTESATLKLNALVQEMQKRGKDVINLTAGEPDFVPAEALKEAAIQAVRENRSKYTPVAGINELRQRIAEKTNAQQRGISSPWTARNVVVTNGAKQGLFNACLALLDPGDEAIIPAPYWLSYPDMVKICEGIPKVIEASHQAGFKIKPAQLEGAITPRTKLLFINSPSNPTGAVYTEKELHALGRVIAKHPGICVLSDEIYDQITYDLPFCSFLAANPDLSERCITFNGLSKSGAITGWRVGWAVAAPALAQALSNVQGHSTSGINSIAQWASLAAFKTDFSPYLEIYRQRRQRVLDILRKSGKIEVVAPQGAFYVFVGVRTCFRDREDSVGWSERLLKDARVCVVPGTPFGDPGSVRLSFATDERSLQEGCERFVQFTEGQESPK